MSYIDYINKIGEQMNKQEIRKRMKNNRSFKKRLQWFMLGQRRCHCCGTQMTWDSGNTARSATVEHLVPASLGGTYHMVNTLITCRRCNSARADKDWVSFVKQHSFPKAEWLIDRYIKAANFYKQENKVVYLKVEKAIKAYLKGAA